MSFYVYVLQDTQDYGPFQFQEWIFTHRPVYVGKGQGNRLVYSMKKREVYYATVIAGLTERAALDFEKALIVHFECEHNHVFKPGAKWHNSREVYQFSLDGVFLNKWDSAHSASRALCGGDVQVSRISAACHRLGSSGGFIWLFNKDQIEEAVVSVREKKDAKSYNSVNLRNSIPVLVTESATGKVTEYRSLSETARALGMLKESVRQRLRHGNEFKGISMKLKNNDSTISR